MNLLILFFIYFKFILVATSFSGDDDIDKLFEFTTTEMIVELGYPIEVHTIQTKDGYILDLHRIPHGKINKTLKYSTPVLIYAGLIGDSACFACWVPDNSIGYILADQGYDVWLGNTRGTTHGKKHIKWDPYKDKRKFWDFSFQEMATYDVPETIDYVLNVTKNKNLYYIGHSQGSTMAFAMLAEKPIYNKKIRLLITLAPLVSMRHSTLLILKLAIKDFSYFKMLIEKQKIYEFMAFSKELQQLLFPYCSNNSTMQESCLQFVCFLIGCNSENINKKYLPFVLSNLPAGASVKQIAHYMQLIEDSFQKYDYGKKDNLKIYNSERPPIYNLSNVRVPTAIFYGTDDVISAYQDVEILVTKLPKIIYKKKIQSYNHVDFIYATDTNSLINDDIVNLIKMH